MRTTELIKLLRANGCSLIRHRKRHDEWYSPISDSTFMVPRHENQDDFKDIRRNNNTYQIDYESYSHY